MTDIESMLEWSEWIPHRNCWSDQRIPAEPGLYRIRRVGAVKWDYVGQTGGGNSHLRKRLAAQKGVYGVEMPYTDPHTAGPALWAILDADKYKTEFEISIAVVKSADPIRKALEAWVIASHRQQHDSSPTANFGRIPEGYKKSSGVSAKLKSAGKQFRGGRIDGPQPHHEPGCPPVGTLEGDIFDHYWAGHVWSPWTPISALAESTPASSLGLYRIRGGEPSRLVYIGEGDVPARLKNHMMSSRTTNDAKAAAFATAGELQASFVLNPGWNKTRRLELECDLIAAHLVATAQAPRAQFGGSSEEVLI